MDIGTIQIHGIVPRKKTNKQVRLSICLIINADSILLKFYSITHI